MDEAQTSYWDDKLWDKELKSINKSTPYMIILFASYGSASRNLLTAVTPFKVEEEQLVGLARGPNSSVGLLLTKEEMRGVVNKRYLAHRFDESLLEFVYSLTSGHVGAYCDSIEVVNRDEVSPHQLTWNMDDNDQSHTVKQKKRASNILTRTLFSTLRCRHSFTD
jgi:hypothetical protein